MSKGLKAIVRRDISANRRQGGFLEPGCGEASNALGRWLSMANAEAVAAARGRLTETDKASLVCVTDKGVAALPLELPRLSRRRALDLVSHWSYGEMRMVSAAPVDKRNDVLMLLPPSGRPDFVMVDAGQGQRLADAAQRQAHFSGGAGAHWWEDQGIRLAVRLTGKLIGLSGRGTPPGTETAVLITANGIQVSSGEELVWIDWRHVDGFRAMDSAPYTNGMRDISDCPGVLEIKTAEQLVVVAVRSPAAALRVQLAPVVAAYPDGNETFEATPEASPAMSPVPPVFVQVDPNVRTFIPDARGQWDQLSVVAFVVGMVGILTAGLSGTIGAFAIILGAVALHRIKGAPNARRGRALAGWALGLGIVAFMGSVFAHMPQS